MDPHTPIGYAFLFSLEFVSVYIIQYATACYFIFPVGIYCFLTASAIDAKATLITLNGENQLEGRKVEMYQKFCRAIEFHSTIKQ